MQTAYGWATTQVDYNRRARHPGRPRACKRKDRQNCFSIAVNQPRVPQSHSHLVTGTHCLDEMYVTLWSNTRIINTDFHTNCTFLLALRTLILAFKFLTLSLMAAFSEDLSSIELSSSSSYRLYIELPLRDHIRLILSKSAVSINHNFNFNQCGQVYDILGNFIPPNIM